MVVRYLCQYVNRLPAPKNLLWGDPGFPTLIVTYDTTHDYFFSGHTAFSLIFASNMYPWNPLTQCFSILLVLTEISYIVFTNGHYFMDIYGGFVSYLAFKYILMFFGI